MVRLWSEPPARREALCRDFASGVYIESFPCRDQVEDADTWLPLMRPDPPDDKPRVFIIVACTAGGEPIGGIVFEFYPACGDWLATYLAVATRYRGQGLGRRLFTSMTEAIAENAGRPSWNMYAEAEQPDALPATQQQEAYNRLSVLDHLGLRRLPFSYIQPALASDKKPVRNLMLLWWSGRSAPPATVNKNDVETFLRTFYRALCFDGITPPEGDAVLEGVLANLAAADEPFVPQRLR